MYDNSCDFEPTFFFRDTDIYTWMSGRLRLEGRDLCEEAHLAWLGLKMQETASPVVLLKKIIQKIVHAKDKGDRVYIRGFLIYKRNDQMPMRLSDLRKNI